MSYRRMMERHDFQMMWKEDKVWRGLMIAMHEHEHLMLHTKGKEDQSTHNGEKQNLAPRGDK